MQIIYDYTDAGFRVFPLYAITQGRCDCGDKKCESVGKHPSMSHWQKVPIWSQEALENMIEYSISTGFGVCVDDHLIIDIDPRNGGDVSFNQLCKDLNLDLRALSGFTVATGGGGWHLYFKRPVGSYSQSLPGYKGIDFKTNGFVVGCDSVHKNGFKYEREKGFPENLTDCPDILLSLLKKNSVVVSEFAEDVTESELKDIVSMIEGVDEYDTWIKVGMGIHHATQGQGFFLWDDWSSKGSKYNSSVMDAKWHSFGKSSSMITVGTLIHLSAWERPITFDAIEIEQEITHEIPFDVSHCDPLRPVGMIGKIVDWFNSNSLYLREHLAVISALTAVGNIAGLYWRDDVSGVPTNLLSICISGTGTGKESIQQSFAEIMRSAGMGATIHGDIKSKQEIMRNLVEHQAACYLTDELGEILKAITNAQKKGGAAYLEGITGEIMKIYTKADAILPISGDLSREMRKHVESKIKAIEENGDTVSESLKFLYKSLKHDGGLPRPFLSLIGYATMESIESALSVELAKNGFLNRAFIVEEMDTNPRPNKKYTGRVSFPYEFAMLQLCAVSDYSANERIEYYDKPKLIKTEQDAKLMLQAVADWQWQFAEYHRETTGYESLVRRAYEFVCKISTILAIADGGIRTVRHIEWATAYIKRDIDEKIRLIRFTASKSGGDIADGLTARAISLAKEGIYRTALVQRLARKDLDKNKIEHFLNSLIEKGILKEIGKKIFI